MQKFMELEFEKNIYSPEFIPFYLDEVKRYKLTMLEWIVYWFIRFYTKWWSSFYFKSKQLADIIWSTEWTINNVIKSLKDKKLLDIETHNVWFKKIRKVKCYSNIIPEWEPSITPEWDKKEYLKQNIIKNKQKDLKLEASNFLHLWNKLFFRTHKITPDFTDAYIMRRKTYDIEDLKKWLEIYHTKNKTQLKNDEWRNTYYLTPYKFITQKKNWFSSYL